MKTPKAFITYSHENKVERKTLEKHLQSISGLLTWNDKELVPGDEWRSVIREELENADILLYLASKASIKSKSCNEELSEALKTGKAKKIRIITIILEGCKWKEKEIDSGESISLQRLSDFIALPEDGKPITEWKNPDMAWKSIIAGIRKAVEIISKEKTTPETSQEDLLFERASFAMLVEQYDRAITLYAAIIELNPTAEAYNNRGIAYGEVNDHDKAIADFSKSIKLNPYKPAAYHNRGVVYGKKDNYKKALADFNKSIELNPHDFRVYFYRGIAYHNKDNHDEALANFNKAIKLNPYSSILYNAYGAAYGRKGDYKKAITNFNKAIKLNPRYIEAYYHLGIAYNKKGDYKKAVTNFNKAIKLNPHYHEAYFGRSEAKKALHDPKGADKDFGAGIAKAAVAVALKQAHDSDS